MTDIIFKLSERDLAELCAFADGTLSHDRRAEVEARVGASPELLELVERQRRSLRATHALASEHVPASLAAAIAARSRHVHARPAGRRRLTLALSAVGVLAAVVVAFSVLSLSGGQASPSLADAAKLAVEPPGGSAPAAVVGTGRLAVSVQGVPFPDLSRALGWRAVGVRHGRVGGRDATVVYYAKAGRQVGYVIVAGPVLPRPAVAQSTTLAGIQYLTLSLQGRRAVTWRRLGHTCLMIGSVPQAELLTLASWDRGGSETY
jgi:anti-sigma factor RsiW